MQVLEGQTSWSTEEARNHITNETATALCTIIVNTYNRVNPFKEWTNAIWYYQWVQENDTTTHCILMAFVLGVAKEIPLQSPARHIWTKLLEQLQTGLAVAAFMERALQITYTEDEICRIVGTELFASDPSPLRPTAKRGRPQQPLPKQATQSEPIVDKHKTPL
jgi:hypothetical protein